MSIDYFTRRTCEHGYLEAELGYRRCHSIDHVIIFLGFRA